MKQALKVYCLGLSYQLAQARSSVWHYELASSLAEQLSEKHCKGAWTQFKDLRADLDRR